MPMRISSTGRAEAVAMESTVAARATAHVAAAIDATRERVALLAPAAFDTRAACTATFERVAQVGALALAAERELDARLRIASVRVALARARMEEE